MGDESTLLNWCTQVTGDSNLKSQPLAVEASHRRFFRLRSGADPNRRWVAMDSPPELEHNLQFLTLAEVFGAADIPVPKIIDKNIELGFILMTDLGELDFTHAYASTDSTIALQTAVDTLIQLQTVTSPHIPAYDEARLNMEFDLFEEWLLRQLLGSAGAALARNHTASLATAKAACITAMLMQPQVCVHRDYHCRNLLYNRDRIGIVDFQDALIGPGLYDLASLLRDCYYQHEEHTVDHWLHYFLSRSPHYDTAELAATKSAFDHTAIQRQVKALGIFARLHLRDNKNSHLRWILPVVRRLITTTAIYDDTQGLHRLLYELQQPLEDALAAYS